MENLLSTLVQWTTRNFSNSQNTVHPKEFITQANYETSTLHSLPSELIFAIDGFLHTNYTIAPNVGKMAFRATCRRFFAILPGPKPGYIPSSWPESTPKPLRGRWKEWDRRAYSQMVRLAWFRDLCKEEREGVYGKDKLVCCICRAFHSKDCFSALEKKKEPEQRACIGAHGVLEVCPHMRITYMALKLGPEDIGCNRTHYSCGGYHGRVRVIKFKGERDAKDREDGASRKGKMCKAEVQLRILDLEKLAKDERNAEIEGEMERDEVWAREKILAAVQRSGWKLCPHMRAQSAELWLAPLLASQPPAALSKLLSHTVFPPPSTSTSTYWLRRSQPSLSSSKFSITHKCTSPDCDTRVMLAREMGISRVTDNIGDQEEKEYLIMKVDRYLGNMKGADGAGWMAQIVEASKLDEDRFDFSGDGNDDNSGEGEDQKQKKKEDSEEGNEYTHGSSSGSGFSSEQWSVIGSGIYSVDMISRNN
jgi:hypothetical protein